jgi:drug/metabolite transporter (DMT)-like permease
LLVTSFAISLVVLFPAMLIYEPHPVARLFVASGSALFGLALISVFSLALATFIFFSVLGEVDATQASLSIYLMPVFGVLLSGAALNETVSLSLLAGGLLVGAGTWLVTVWEQRAAKRSVAAS